MSRSIGAVSFRQEQTCETNTCFNISFVIIFYNFQIAILNFDDKVIKTILNLIQLLYHNSSNQCIIQTLVSQGFVTGELKEGFPAENIAKNDNFISLLYYFGLVTIGGFYQGDTKFTIPNEVVREQIFTYLLEAYEENDLSFESYDIRKKEQQMAYCGEFKPFFQYIADSIYTFASQRDRQKGEAFVHGYTLALTSQCRFYRPISELDNQNGYADIFLRPLHEIFTFSPD